MTGSLRHAFVYAHVQFSVIHFVSSVSPPVVVQLTWARALISS
jgi:hypothetical protein